MSVLPTRLAGDAFAISTHELTKRYRGVPALQKVCLQVPEGAVYLLAGPNGAGKSTTIKLILDLVEPTSGSARVFGVDPRKQPALVRANIGYVPEQLAWGYSWMRVRTLLEHHARYFPSWDWPYAKLLTRIFDLRVDQRLGTLSKGQSRRVHLVLALAHRPPVLILDEPTDGLDPVMRDDTLAVLVDHLASTPTTVLLCTHHVSEFELVADHIGILRNNELCAQMPMAALRDGLRRYRGQIPPGWTSRALFGGAVLRRKTTPRDIDWTIWGNEVEIIHELTIAGASIRAADGLTLDEAALAMLDPREIIA